MPIARTPLKWVDAVREAVPIFVGVAGSSSSGKTVSLLRIATGIARMTGKPIGVLDTEAGRTRHYSDRFQFKISEIKPPFNPEAFMYAAMDAEDNGMSCLIFDSFSAEWAGEGGVLDLQQQDLQKRAGDDYKKRMRSTMASWIEPKRRHKTMMSSFQQRRIPILFSLRAERKTKPADDGGDPVDVGWQFIGDKRLLFELTVFLTLDPERPGVPVLGDPKLPTKIEGQHRPLFPPGKQLDESVGEALWRWAHSASAARLSQPPQESPPPPQPPGSPPADPAAPEPSAPGPAAGTAQADASEAEARRFAERLCGEIAATDDADALRRLLERAHVRRGRDRLREAYPDLDGRIGAALSEQTARITAATRPPDAAREPVA